MPVEAQVMLSAPFSSALTTPIALARSLKEAVGLRPSSFTNRRATPNSGASRTASYKGVHPTCKCWIREGSSTGSNGKYRHMEKVRLCRNAAGFNSFAAAS